VPSVVVRSVFFEYGQNPKRLFIDGHDDGKKTKCQKTFWVFYEKTYACAVVPIYIMYLGAYVGIGYRVNALSFVRRRIRTILNNLTDVRARSRKKKSLKQKNGMKHVAFITPFSVVQ